VALEGHALEHPGPTSAGTDDMLIEFTVENYRSFADPQTLSLAAAKDASHPAHVVERGPLRLLKAASIYGPNASGKSNLVKAIRFMDRFVETSATRMNLGDPIAGVHPFRLEKEWRARPSSFQVRLLIDNTEYLYGFSATQERVHDEWLHVRREGGRVTRPFLRRLEPETGKTEWALRGELKEQAASVIGKTRDNGLFLSRAAEMNVEFVKELFLWFRRHLWCFDLSMPPVHLMLKTARRVNKDAEFLARVERLLHDADLGIDHIEVREVQGHLQKLLFTADEGKASKHPLRRWVVQTLHHIPGSPESVEFSLDQDESNGTQRFFALIGPILDVLDDGDLLVLDELDCSMHPLLTQKLVQLFHSPDANPKGAQLVFATHDSTLMTPSLFRRDQIWLTEKNRKGATELFSLCEIEPGKRPRKHEAFEKNYLSGRYGGVPSFGPALEDLEVR
jgi:hypothetical protein